MRPMERTWRGIALAAAWLAAATAVAAPSTEVVRAGEYVLTVDVHRPVGAARDAVVLAHGFLRSRATMSGHAAALASDGVLALAPDLPSRVDSRENGRALAQLVAAVRDGALGTGVDRVVLAGFSAGGLAALLAADAPGVAGYVGLDPFDRPGRVGLAAARALRTPAILLRGPPSFCNAYGIAAPWSGALRALVEERTVAGASHCDFEWPTDGLCTTACGAVEAGRQREVRDALRAAVRRLLAAPPDVATGAGAGVPRRRDD